MQCRGLGVQAVIAPSFGYIYGRNQVLPCACCTCNVSHRLAPCACCTCNVSHRLTPCACCTCNVSHRLTPCACCTCNVSHRLTPCACCTCNVSHRLTWACWGALFLIPDSMKLPWRDVVCGWECLWLCCIVTVYLFVHGVALTACCTYHAAHRSWCGCSEPYGDCPSCWQCWCEMLVWNAGVKCWCEVVGSSSVGHNAVLLCTALTTV